MASRHDGIVGALLIALVVSGCTHVERPEFPTTLSAGVELTQTPFFPQESHQCGPAALATALGASGVAVTPDDLVPQVYVPGRRGSLQLELIAAARRHHRIAYVLDAEPAALLAELDAAHPVVVLQDLGVGPLHVWHYAVVIGYQPHERRVVLRSGKSKRLVTAYDDFLRSWRRGDFWAIVVLDGATLPATADATRYVDSIVPLETLGDTETARAAYATALTRWPDNVVALFGLANTEHKLGQFAAAEQAYRRLLALAPDNAIVLNNLAEVMLDRGCAARALVYADAALEHLAAGSADEAAVRDTRAHAAAAAADNPGECAAD